MPPAEFNQWIADTDYRVLTEAPLEHVQQLYLRLRALEGRGAQAAANHVLRRRMGRAGFRDWINGIFPPGSSARSSAHTG